VPAGAWRKRSIRCDAVTSKIQALKATPITVRGDGAKLRAAMPAKISVARASQRRRRSTSPTGAPFQRTKGPTARSSSTGTISGTNTVSKYGGPTEILPMPSASRNSGYMVPSSTVAAATKSRTLFTSSSDSRDTRLNLPPRPTLGARQA